MSADGSIIIETDIDDEKAQQELNRLNRKIQTLNDQIYVKQQQKMPLVEQARQLGAELDVAKAKLNEMQSAPKGSFTTESIKEQQEMVRALQVEWDRVQGKVESYDAGIKKASIELDLAKERAGGIHQQLTAANPATQAMSQAMERMQKSAGKFSMRLREVIRSALIFTVISQGLASLRDWFGKVVKSNDEATASIARLKGALLTLAQPLIEVIIPAFTAFVNILTIIVSAIANIVSILFGKTAQESSEAAESLYDEANAIESVGSAAKKAQGSLAGFDEINQLSSPSAGGGVGGIDTGTISPIFDSFNIEEYKRKIDELTAYLSGALLALGAILAFSGVNIPLGLALMAAGAVGLVSLLSQDWTAMDSSLKSAITRVLEVLSVAALAIGAILCFSGANIPLGIGLIVAGATALGTAIALNWSSMDQNIKKSIVGVLEIVGSALLVIGSILTFSGANLPLGIGLMLAGAASLGASVALNWELTGGNIKKSITEITLLLGTSLLAVGAIIAISGANIPLGIGIIVAGAASLATAAALNWNYITSALQGEIGTITAFVSGALLVIGIILCLSGVALPLGIALIAAGSVGLVTVTALNWNAILDKLKEVWRDITGWFGSNVEKYLSWDYWKEKGANILNGLWDGLKSIWQNITSWVSEKVSWITSKFSGTKAKVSAEYALDSRAIQQKMKMISPVEIQNIPQLARGAVIPPNRKFMAVLGDQTRGTNIEAPESLIRKIVREESGNMNTELLQAILEAIRAGQVIKVNETVLGRTSAKAINKVTRASGKSVLLY